MKSVLFAQFKGGTGKTLLAHHVSELAAELGQRVLAIDSDPQGDLYRRLARLPTKPIQRPTRTWAKGCTLVGSVGSYVIPLNAQRDYDLVVVDSRPQYAPPDGLPDLAIVPVDGVDAFLNASETIATLLDRRVRRIVLVDNGTSEGGKQYAEEFADMADGLPDVVEVCPVKLPRGGAIKRTSLSTLPAWKDKSKGADAWAIQELCKWVLAALK